jgi:hypothetical protein
MTRDLRKHARQTRTRLIIGLIVLVFVVGDGLIYWLLGKSSALMGLLCLAAALIPAGIVWLILALLDWTVKHVDRD